MEDALKEMVTTMEMFKLLLPLIITMVISVVGWVIAHKHNAAQLIIAAEKNRNDLEVSRINAGLKYMEVIQGEAADDPELIKQTQTIAAPILPPDLAFDLAFRNIHSNPNMMLVLRNKYADDTPELISRFYKQFPFELRGVNKRKIVNLTPEYEKYLDELKSEEDRLYLVLDYLHEENLLDDLYALFLAENFQFAEFRDRCFYYYFRFLEKQSEERRSESIDRVRIASLLDTITSDESISDSTKADLVTAAALVHVSAYGDDRDRPIIELASKYFWEGSDVSIGESPSERELRWLLLQNRFIYKQGAGFDGIFESDGVKLVSDQLWKRIEQLNFNAFTFEQARLLLYHYAQTHVSSTRIDRESGWVHKPYLMPDKIVRLVSKILSSLNSTADIDLLGWEFGSLSGHNLFINVYRIDHDAGREYVEMMVKWYEANQKPEWPPAAFLGEAADAYPEFGDRIAAIRRQ